MTTPIENVTLDNMRSDMRTMTNNINKQLSEFVEKYSPNDIRLDLISNFAFGCRNKWIANITVKF